MTFFDGELYKRITDRDCLEYVLETTGDENPHAVTAIRECMETLTVIGLSPDRAAEYMIAILLEAGRLGKK